jgi:hypothetical protein
MPEKDTYEFQKARVVRIADELGKQVDFDDTVSWMKFRATDKGKKGRATPHSGDFLPGAPHIAHFAMCGYRLDQVRRDHTRTARLGARTFWTRDSVLIRE